jgi:hypothetical protein
MAIGKIARDTGYVPRWDLTVAAREWLAWQHEPIVDRKRFTLF